MCEVYGYVFCVFDVVVEEVVDGFFFGSYLFEHWSEGFA